MKHVGLPRHQMEIILPAAAGRKRLRGISRIGRCLSDTTWQVERKRGNKLFSRRGSYARYVFDVHRLTTDAWKTTRQA